MGVEDNFFGYYNDLILKLQEEYPTMKGGTVYKATPPSFPYIYFSQIGGSTALTTLSGTEEGIDLGLQTEIYSKVSAADARNIANSTRQKMIKFGFTCNYFRPEDNIGDTTIHRFVARFEKLET